MINKYSDFISRHCRLLAIIAIISVILPAYYLKNLKIDNSIEVWLRHDSKEYLTYQKFLKRYGNEEFIIVAAEEEDPYSLEYMEFQKKLSDKIRGINGVARVLDISDISRIMLQNPMVPENTIRKNDYLQDFIIGKDGKCIGTFIWLEGFDNPQERKKSVEAIEKVVNDLASDDFIPHLAGTPLMNIELDRGSQKASLSFLPIALGISILALALMLKKIKGVIAAMCSVTLTTVWTIGLMVMTGHTLNMVTVVLPSLLFVLSLSSSIHITSRFYMILSETGERVSALKETSRELIRPVFISSITTSVGFASLMVSDIQPISDFGKFAAIGMVLSFFFNMIVVTGVLSLLRSTPGKLHNQKTVEFKIGSYMIRHKWYVAFTSIVLLVFSVAAITKAKVESNVLKFFPENSRISRDYKFIGEKLTGFYTVELELESHKGDSLVLQKKMKELSRVISARAEVSRILDYNHIKKISPLGDDKKINELFGKYTFRENGYLSYRMSVLINAAASSDFYKLLDFIDIKAEKILGKDIDYNITGVVPLLNDVQKSLINTQIRSFAIAAIVVLFMIGLFMHSFSAALASVFPNILPVCIMFACMVLFDIPLDAATVMIASVAIGIAVDDTIHFLSQYKLESMNKNPEKAVNATLSKVGKAIVFTSVVITLGFSVLCLADFRPIIYFGALTAITMLAALGCDIMILPAFIGIFRLWDKPLSSS